MKFTPEEQLYAEIVQKAWENEEFKNEFIANPLEAIENLTGKKLIVPEGKTMIVRDQSDTSKVFINIPAAAELDAELNEEQLEAVAGGCMVDSHLQDPVLGWPGTKVPIKDFLSIQSTNQFTK